MLSANILLSGNNYRKVALLFKFMAMGMVTESTYYRIQDAYCIEPVQDFWENINAKVMERMRQKDHIVVLGEGYFCFFADINYVEINVYQRRSQCETCDSNAF